MITIQIPFPVSISISSSINALLLLSLLLLWISSWLTKLILRGKKYMILYSASAKHQSTVTARKAKPCDRNNIITNAGALPDDAWAEVLCKLSPKLMVRCKLVSKSWNRLISDVCIPHITSPLYGLFVPTGFTCQHISSTSAWHFACLSETEPRTSNTTSSFIDSCFRMLPFNLIPEYFLDSSNGLLLTFDHLSCRFYVSNPSTQQFIALPRCPDLSKPSSAALTFDDPHFNVVYILHNPLRMFIYSSATCAWAHHPFAHLSDSRTVTQSTSRYVFLDGFLYNFSMTGDLLQFDFKDEIVRKIKLPTKVEGKHPLGCLGVSKGRLHYAWFNRETFRILVWKHHHSRWVWMHSVYLIDFAKHEALKDLPFLAPYAFHPTSDVLYLGNELGIFCYYPDSEKLERVFSVSSGTSITDGQVLVFPFSRKLTTLV